MKSTQTSLPSISGIGAFFPSDGNSPDRTAAPITQIMTDIASPTDVRGTFALPGSGNGTANSCSITFYSPYNKRPIVQITPAASTMSTITDENWNYYIDTTKSGFTFYFYTKNNHSNTNYYFNYFVIE